MTPHRKIDTGRGISLVALKAFGDLVIMVSCMERRSIGMGTSVELLLARHLQPLFDALESKISTRIVAHRETSLPSLFTIKSDGLANAVRSALGLRRAIDDAQIPPENVLVFDRLGIRERLVTNGRERLVIPQADNIYLSYDRFFDGLALPDLGRDHLGDGRGPVRIFPGSRVPAKNLPVGLISGLIATSTDRGNVTELMLLEGERPDLEASGLPFTLVPRSFAAMIGAVRGAGKVISADSMPAHIAEHAGRAVFVFSPVPNRYWLPRSTFLSRWDALFDDDASSSRLAGFLDAA